MYRLPKYEIQQPNCCQPPVPGNVFLLAFTKAAPRQVDKGREQSERLRSSSPLVIRERAGRIKKQKNKLPRPSWTVCGRPELRKKIYRPACPQPWPQFREWREHGAGSPQAKKKRAEARAQRNQCNLRISLHPRHRGQFSFAIASIFLQSVGRFSDICVRHC